MLHYLAEEKMTKFKAAVSVTDFSNEIINVTRAAAQQNCAMQLSQTASINLLQNHLLKRKEQVLVAGSCD